VIICILGLIRYGTYISSPSLQLKGPFSFPLSVYRYGTVPRMLTALTTKATFSKVLTYEQVGSRRRGKYEDFEGEEESSDGGGEIGSYLGKFFTRILFDFSLFVQPQQLQCFRSAAMNVLGSGSRFSVEYCDRIRCFFSLLVKIP